MDQLRATPLDPPERRPSDRDDVLGVVGDEAPPLDVDVAAYLLSPPPSSAQLARAQRRRVLVGRVTTGAALVVAVALVAPWPGAADERRDVPAPLDAGAGYGSPVAALDAVADGDAAALSAAAPDAPARAATRVDVPPGSSARRPQSTVTPSRVARVARPPIAPSGTRAAPRSAPSAGATPPAPEPGASRATSHSGSPARPAGTAGTASTGAAATTAPAPSGGALVPVT